MSSSLLLPAGTTTTTSAQPHAPLFVLRAHDSGVLSCAFYMTRHAHDARASLLLSGDVDGDVILWDAQLRRPLLRFAAVATARVARALPAVDEATHNTLGVLAVGFLTPDDDDDDAAKRSTYAANSNNNSNNNKMCGVVATLASRARVRFRVQRPRRQHTRSDGDAAAATTTTTSAHGALRSSSSSLSPLPLLFYTQCRDRCVYVWQYVMSASARAGDAVDDAQRCVLLHVLPVPQYGFCPIAVATHTRRTTTTTTTTATARWQRLLRSWCAYVIVPHDTDGTVSVWCGVARRGYGTDAATRRRDCAPPSSDEANDNNDGDGKDIDDDDSAAEAAAAAAAHVPTAPPCRGAAATYHAAHSPLQLHCVGVFATVPSSVQAGSIMRLSVVATTDTKKVKADVADRASVSQSAVTRLCVAFESGHVSLCELVDTTAQRQRSNDDGDDAAAGDSEVTRTATATATEASATTRTCALRVLCTARAFAESAMACVWQRDRVVATSVEGRVHCYVVARAHTAASCVCDKADDDNDDNNGSGGGGGDDDVVTNNAAPHSRSKRESTTTTCKTTLQLQWEAKAGKGIGSVVVQGDVAILGAWDGTLRVYDVCSGAVLSVMPFHTATVNDVAAPHPHMAAALLSFAFDVRRPRCAGAAGAVVWAGDARCNSAMTIGASSSNEDDDENDNGDGVYVCASASRDYTLAVWRIDFRCLP